MNESLILPWATWTVLSLSVSNFMRQSQVSGAVFPKKKKNTPKVRHTNLHCDVTNHYHHALNHTAIFIQRRPPHTGNSIGGCRALGFGPVNLHSGCATADTKKLLTLYCGDCFTTPCMSHKHTSCMCTTPTQTPRQRAHSSTESVNNTYKGAHEDMTEAQWLECRNTNGDGRRPQNGRVLGEQMCVAVGGGGEGGGHTWVQQQVAL